MDDDYELLTEEIINECLIEIEDNKEDTENENDDFNQKTICKRRAKKQ